MRTPRQNDDAVAEKVWALVLLLLAVWLLAVVASGCAIPDLLSFSNNDAPPLAADPVTGIFDSATTGLWSWAWLSILLLLFLPGIRQPLLVLWTAVFRALAIPFLFVRQKFDIRAGHERKTKRKTRRTK
jgi:beta-lactamase regulating signal transducer with metallopeptidase domain